MKVRQLCSLIKSDFVRVSELWEKKLTFFSTLKMLMLPSLFAITFYRFYHFLYVNNLGFLAWPMWGLNITLTGADLHPASVIGRGFYIGHPVATVVCGRIGDNVTLTARVGIGGIGVTTKDVGAGPGLPYLKDNVQVGVGVVILGAVLVEENAVIAPCTFLRKSVPPGAIVSGNPAVIRKRSSVSK